MSGSSAKRRILIATIVAGTLDIAAAIALTVTKGGEAARMLRGVASGPVREAAHWGLGGAVLGLTVHFAIMAAMAAVFVLAADRITWLKQHAIAAGVAYGIATWAVMNQIVLPLRWPAIYPQYDALSVFTQLTCHIFLVGIPIALIARR